VRMGHPPGGYRHSLTVRTSTVFAMPSSRLGNMTFMAGPCPYDGSVQPLIQSIAMAGRVILNFLGIGEERAIWTAVADHGVVVEALLAPDGTRGQRLAGELSGRHRRVTPWSRKAGRNAPGRAGSTWPFEPSRRAVRPIDTVQPITDGWRGAHPPAVRRIPASHDHAAASSTATCAPQARHCPNCATTTG